ncbi:MAG: hypothetical protein ACE10G_07540 [Gemmatimonadales bacterium]
MAIRWLVVTTIWAAALSPSVAVARQSPVDIARAYREAHGAQILDEFRKLLAIPNVASDSVGINENAAYIRDALMELGVDAELLRIPGVPPIVYGELAVPGATRTLGIYVHYDGQPVDSSRWSHGPWTPTLYTRAP